MLTRPPVCDFGWKAPDFELPSTDGASVSLQSIRGSSGTMVMFICNHCPYVVSAIDRIVRDAGQLQEIGVSTVAICANDSRTYPQDSFERMVEFARTHGFSFPYLHDDEQSVARAYGAECTPDFFGFNSDLELQYRGRLDSAGSSLPSSTDERELFNAMTQVAGTGKGPEDQTASMGCSIKWR